MDLAAALAPLARHGTCRLTVRGRKSGKAFTLPIWFAVDGDRLIVETLDVQRNWVRNALANGAVQIEIAGQAFAGRFEAVADPAEATRLKALFVRKYWAAWLASFVGVGPDGVFTISRLAAQ